MQHIVLKIKRKLNKGLLQFFRVTYSHYSTTPSTSQIMYDSIRFTDKMYCTINKNSQKKAYRYLQVNLRVIPRQNSQRSLRPSHGF
jgi:hypothetical protein